MLLYNVYYYRSGFDKDVPLPKPTPDMSHAVCTNGERVTYHARKVPHADNIATVIEKAKGSPDIRPAKREYELKDLEEIMERWAWHLFGRTYQWSTSLSDIKGQVMACEGAWEQLGKPTLVDYEWK